MRLLSAPFKGNKGFPCFLLFLMVIVALFSNASAQDSCENSKGEEAVKVGAAAATGAVSVSTLGTLAGFGTAGIAKGSVAAAFQSMFGTVGGFSVLQSIGATGGMAVLGPAGLVGAGLGAAGYYFLR